jgi:hypothetical protein
MLVLETRLSARGHVECPKSLAPSTLGILLECHVICHQHQRTEDTDVETGLAIIFDLVKQNMYT